MTSYLFPEARFSLDRLNAVLKALDQDSGKLVIDLSCRRAEGKWMVAMNKWQTLTDMEVNRGMKSPISCISSTVAEGVQQTQSAYWSHTARSS